MVCDLSRNHPEIRFSEFEKVLLKCYWYGMGHQEILKVLSGKRSELNYYYNDNYFRMGLEPNIMKKLSRLIDRSVNKKNFKEVFQQIWKRENIYNQLPTKTKADQ